MLRSYEAYYENGRFRWIGDKPDAERAKVIVTLLSEQDETCPINIRSPSPHIACKGKINCDIMAPAAEVQDWDVLK